MNWRLVISNEQRQWFKSFLFVFCQDTNWTNQRPKMQKDLTFIVLSDQLSMSVTCSHNLPVCTVTVFIETHKGHIIGTFHQYANYVKPFTLSIKWSILVFRLMIHLIHSMDTSFPSMYTMVFHLRFIHMSPPTDQEMEF